jgi:hypothetical protein
MTHAHHFPAPMMHVPPAAAVFDDGRFALAVSCDQSRTAAIVADSSIATTVSPSAGTPRRNSAPSDASAENPFRIPSTNTSGFAVAALVVSCLAGVGVVDSVVELLDLDRGSWEGSLPESSSLGGDASPLRGAFVTLQPGGFKNSLRGRLYQLCGAGDILAAINSRRLGPFWSAKMAQSFTAADRSIPVP